MLKREEHKTVEEFNRDSDSGTHPNGGPGPKSRHTPMDRFQCRTFGAQSMGFSSSRPHGLAYFLPAFQAWIVICTAATV